MSPIQNWGNFVRFSELSGDNFNQENGIDRATVIFFLLRPKYQRIIDNAFLAVLINLARAGKNVFDIKQ